MHRGALMQSRDAGTHWHPAVCPRAGVKLADLQLDVVDGGAAQLVVIDAVGEMWPRCARGGEWTKLARVGLPRHVRVQNFVATDVGVVVAMSDGSAY